MKLPLAHYLILIRPAVFPEFSVVFKSELGWVAQWRGDRWWVLGLFSSPYGTRFVVDASVIGGKVYADLGMYQRPSATWVRATARRW